VFNRRKKLRKKQVWNNLRVSDHKIEIFGRNIPLTFNIVLNTGLENGVSRPVFSTIDFRSLETVVNTSY